MSCQRMLSKFYIRFKVNLLKSKVFYIWLLLKPATTLSCLKIFKFLNETTQLVSIHKMLNFKNWYSHLYFLEYVFLLILNLTSCSLTAFSFFVIRFKVKVHTICLLSSDIAT